MSDSLQLLIKSAFDSSGITAAANSINKLDSQINRVSRATTKFMGLFAAGGIGMAVFAFSKKAIAGYAEEERAISKRNNALLNLGITNQAVARDLDRMAEALERTVKAEKEDILAVQTSLIQRGLYGAELQKAIPTVLDLATKTGSLSGAADIVGKAFQGVARGLNTVGVILPANIDKTQVYTEAMRQLNEMYGGAAQAEMDNMAGKMELLGKRFDGLTDRIGELLSGPAGGVIGWFEDLATVLETVSSPRSEARLEGLYETINQLQIRLSKLKAPKSGFWDWLDRSPQAIARIEQSIKNYQSLINLAESQKRPTGGSTKPTRPVGALVDDDQERVKAQKKAADDAARRASIMRQVDEFNLSERGRLYTAFFGQINMAGMQSFVAQAKDAEDMKERQQAMLRELENSYNAASHTFSGGFRQAVLETQQSLWNFRDGWNQVINTSVAPTQAALKEFFSGISKGAVDMGTLLEKTFRSIRDAFYNMITEMIARWLVLQAVTGGLGASSGITLGVKKLLGFSSGGPIPGPRGAPMPILAHGGEFMLSANVVDAIKAGKPTSGLSGAGSAPASSTGSSLTINQTINAGAGTDVKSIFKAAADGAKKGVSEFVDFAKVSYKVGEKKSVETSI